MGEEDVFDKKKSHRERHSGRKAEKKKIKKNAVNPVEELSDKQRNPKAFAFNSAIRAERRFRRKQDIETKKQHIPLVDRTPLEPPPILIGIVGAPKVGKTTLINNMIKLFTKSPLTDIKGPVTVVTGKKRRVTFIECNNDINSMIDLAKVADLVLLLCDASFGFEMEVFEFINICQVHGMPKIMGVLTHLDLIKNSKTLKNTKKTLKHRFWTEVYPGAKLFYLSGIMHGEYLRNEIKNLGRFISIMKFRALTWKMSHSYLLGDRYEDLTNQELVRKNPKCDRNISLYGYVRGVPLKKETSVHIAGLGDLKIQDISYLPDPCPLPDKIKKRALIEKEKLIYAPFSGVGGIVYDKDAVYVEMGTSNNYRHVEDDDETTNIVSNLVDAKETLDVKMKHSEMQIFTGGEKITGSDIENIDDDDVSDTGDGIRIKQHKDISSIENDLDEELKNLRNKNFGKFTEEKIEDSGRIRRKVIFDTSDADLVKENDASDSDEENVDTEAQVYTTLSSNKDSDVHLKIRNVINDLQNKNSFNMDDGTSDSDDDSDEEGDADLVKLTKKISKDNDLDIDLNDVEDTEDEEEDDEDLAVKWKENLAKKAKDAFLDRVNSTQNLMKLVYGVFDSRNKRLQEEEAAKDSENDEYDVADMLRVASHAQHKKKQDKDVMNLTESSLMLPWNAATKDWLEQDNKDLILNCFVTGKWKESEDASNLLKMDDAEDLSDMDGDFEDLETGVKHVSSKKPQENGGDASNKRTRDENEEDDLADRQAIAEKKRKLKEKFDAEYDNTDKSTYYDELKSSAEKQAQLNKTVFENMPDDVRIQLEGYRPGMYVRIEFEKVPAEFVTNFDPNYPIVIGALNMGEENVGYLNVKIKKHRWHQKILKTRDPLIISLGWRRFQTIPIYSKLEDDLKCRYLKYTPEHIGCDAYFWGPITPQGTGFLALQSLQSDPALKKKHGFRIAATGSVQELDKSTQIMKILKLVGYPLKIYKKTAFIQGMFSSALEVARFEGARIKTVSGIRGVIKKAVNKPEGCFRATFEDKIKLSDIIFCRTWFKVEVPQFYNPVTTLLLPKETKNSWKGLRTTADIKREHNIRNPASEDSLYRPIEREERPFKPLIVPRKLQKALPYRDKPNNGVQFSEQKKPVERVAVIREPREQKISTMMKMIKAAYQQKKEKLKAETKARLEKHREVLAAQETMKDKKMKQKKKEVFRKKSKAQQSHEK